MTTLIPLTNFPGGFVNGVTIRNIPVLNTWSGPVFWVDSNGPGGTYKGTFARPFLTVAAAIAAIPTAQNNVLIMVKAGHAETIATAGAWTIANTGIRIQGVGVGSERPQITFSAAASSVLVSSAGFTFDNVICLAGSANASTSTNPINVQAADATINIEWRDTSGKEAQRVILANASAANLTVNLKYVGLTSSATAVDVVRLTGVTNARLVLDVYGSPTTGVVNFVTTACSNIAISGIVQNTASTPPVVDTITGSTWTSNLQNAVTGAGGWNYLGVTATLTVANGNWQTVAFHRVLQVSGVNDVYITPIITTTLVGATGTYVLGDVTGSANNIIGSTAVAVMTQGYIWSATTPVTSYVGSNSPGALHVITNGYNIGYTIGTASATAGVILFACYWRPLTPGSYILAGGGQGT